MRLSSHEGGGGWPGGVGGLPPGLFGGAKSMFGDGSYSGNVIQGGSVLQPVGGVLTITGDATVAPDAVTGACVVTCDTLVLDGAGASLKPSTNSKGLIVFAKTRIQLLNGAKINIDRLGKAGDFGNLTAWDLTPDSLKRKLNRSKLSVYVVLGEGAAGAVARTSSGAEIGVAGSAAGSMQTGGGGSGGLYTNGNIATIGRAGKGGPCAGGAGSGAIWTDQAGWSSANAGDYGGPGGAAGGNAPSPGGAGDPVGAGAAGGNPGEGAGGGLLMLFSPSISIASGCIVSADGAKGGNGDSSAYPSGGSAGGGIMCIVTKAGGYSNLGTVRASGGDSYSAAYGRGGPGGAGSVNIFTAA